jgi:hypothetical protein
MHLPAKLFWSALPLFIGLIIPSAVIFYLEVFVGHVSPATAFLDIGRRQFAEGHNLFLLALIGLIPFGILAVATFVAARWLSARRSSCIIIGGLLGILALMIPAHASVWYPLYGGGHMSSTAIIVFLFIPFYCIATLVVGMSVGLAVSFLPFFRSAVSDSAPKAFGAGRRD